MKFWKPHTLPYQKDVKGGGISKKFVEACSSADRAPGREKACALIGCCKRTNLISVSSCEAHFIKHLSSFSRILINVFPTQYLYFCSLEIMRSHEWRTSLSPRQSLY